VSPAFCRLAPPGPGRCANRGCRDAADSNPIKSTKFATNRLEIKRFENLRIGHVHGADVLSSLREALPGPWGNHNRFERSASGHAIRLPTPLSEFYSFRRTQALQVFPHPKKRASTRNPKKYY
jgi:hypothetical protein